MRLPRLRRARTLVPTWHALPGEGQDDLRDVLTAVRATQAARRALLTAEQDARAAIAQAEADERRRQREADAAAWSTYLGREPGNCYYGCGCND